MSRRQADRSIVAPQFGALLTTLRGAHTSRGIICAKLARFGLALDRSTLLQYERGTVASPSPTILWGLAQIYRVPLNDLVVALLRDVSTNRTQVWHHDEVEPEQRALAELASAMSPTERQTLVALLDLLLRERTQPTLARARRPAR